MKTRRMFNIGKSIGEQLCQGLKDTDTILTLIRFFIYPWFGRGDNFNLVRSQFFCFDSSCLDS